MVFIRNYSLHHGAHCFVSDHRFCWHLLFRWNSRFVQVVSTKLVIIKSYYIILCTNFNVKLNILHKYGVRCANLTKTQPLQHIPVSVYYELTYKSKGAAYIKTKMCFFFALFAFVILILSLKCFEKTIFLYTDINILLYS